MSPIYEFTCSNCGHCAEVYSSRVSTETSRDCSCGAVMHKIISHTARPIILDYYSDQLGCQITSPEQKKRVMKEKGVMEAPPISEMGENPTRKPYTLD